MTAIPKPIAQQEASQGITIEIPNLLIDFCCVCGEGDPCGGDVQIRQNERRKTPLEKEERWEQGGGWCWVKGLSTGHPLTWGQAQKDE